MVNNKLITDLERVAHTLQLIIDKLKANTITQMTVRKMTYAERSLQRIRDAGFEYRTENNGVPKPRGVLVALAKVLGVSRERARQIWKSAGPAAQQEARDHGDDLVIDRARPSVYDYLTDDVRTLSELANRMGVAASTLNIRLKMRGIKYSVIARLKHNNITYRHRQYLQQLLDAGFDVVPRPPRGTYRDVAAALGVSYEWALRMWRLAIQAKYEINN